MTTIDFQLGPARPNPPKMVLQNILKRAADATLGSGSSVTIFSGMENAGSQHGSNRHKTGLAADIRVYYPDGKLLTLSDPNAAIFMVNCAKFGARGIGAGMEYMGNAFHIDMVPHSQYSGSQGPVWKSFAVKHQSAIMSAMRGGPGDLSSLQLASSDNMESRPGPFGVTGAGGSNNSLVSDSLFEDGYGSTAVNPADFRERYYSRIGQYDMSGPELSFGSSSGGLFI